MKWMKKKQKEKEGEMKGWLKWKATWKSYALAVATVVSDERTSCANAALTRLQKQYAFSGTL